MLETEIGATWSGVGLAALSAFAILLTVITYTRITGLRSFSKMSSFDFAATVAIGSTMATVALSNSSLAIGATALGTFYATQALIAFLRRKAGFGAVVDNTPLVLMIGRDFLHDNLDRARVTADDVRSKLREANVYDLDRLKAVVLESTGDISVIHGEGALDLEIFADVHEHRRLAHLARPST